MRSRQDRFGSTSKTAQPGPGEYTLQSAFKVDKKSIVITEQNSKSSMKKNPPSIPSKNQTFGYDYDDKGNLIMQNNPLEQISEEFQNKPQFTNANEQSTSHTVTKTQGYSFGKGAERKTFKKPETEVGPGQ